MPVYYYQARDYEGLVHRGTIEAAAPSQVVELMNAVGLFVTDLRPHKATWKKWAFLRRVSLKDLAVFSRQLAVMVRGHLPLVKALEVLAAQTSNSFLKGVVLDLKNQVEKGKALHEAMDQHPEAFPELFVAMVGAGEEAGLLDDALEILARHYEKEDAVVKKVKTASIYPVVVLAFAVLVVVFLISFVLPRFSRLFSGFGAQLPWPTRFLLACGNFLHHNYLFLTWLLFVAVFGLIAFLKSEEGKNWWDWCVLKLPVLGKIYMQLAVYRFSKILGNLVQAGVPILRALEVAANTVGNRVVASGIMAARANIREGETIAAPLAATGVFPLMVTEMIAVGESTGSLDEMLHQVAAYTEGELTYTLDNLTSLLEPVLILFIAGVVGFVVLSIFLPIVSTWKALGTLR
ncbi:MAG: type II secretion system F family protein [Firmicutes bacterium]|nr:type II secretion system F family protein [Bacillota bacterium]